MSFVHSEPVVSGVPYPVSDVSGGQEPGSLDQFVGSTSFTVRLRQEYVVCGCGSFDGKSVRFYEKDNDGDGKDVRIWRITAQSGGTFTAMHEAVW